MTGSVTDVVPTGIEGLDLVLHGGLPRGRLHLVQGRTGTGKTTLGLQFALAGVAAGEATLYLSLAETEAEIAEIAGSHGWSLDGVTVIYRGTLGSEDDKAQTVFHPGEIELPATLDSLFERTESLQPARVVIDSLSELRVLAREDRWYRHELMRLRRRLEGMGATALLLDTTTSPEGAESLLGGVLHLESSAPSYGPDRRRLHVAKMRGHEHETGYHDVRIRRGGLTVYPRLVAASLRRRFDPGLLSTGLDEFDAMLGGGLDDGTAILLLGPTGTGKSTLALQCAAAAAQRGENVLVYVFDERVQTVFQRAAGIGLDIEQLADSGRMTIRQVDPAELTPGEFADEVRRKARDERIRVIVLDSLNAYLYAMPDESFLNVHLHELLSHLSQQGVTTLLIGTQHGLGSSAVQPSDIDVSYLADTVVLLRILEVQGRLRKAITVFKRRAGPHADTVRELRLEPGRICIGSVLPVTRLTSGLEGTASGGIGEP